MIKTAKIANNDRYWVAELFGLNCTHIFTWQMENNLFRDTECLQTSSTED